MEDHVTTQKFPATDGFKLAYRCWNAKSIKRLVLCIHGIGDYSGWFRNLAPALAADGAQVYALDLRGFGGSQEDGYPRGYTNDFERHLQDIDNFIVHLRAIHKGKKLFVLGHSLGGVYTLWYAANHPDALDGLVLAAPAVASALNNRKNAITIFLTNAFTPKKTHNPYASASAKKRDPEEIKIMLADSLETPQLTVNYLSNVKSRLLKDVFKNAVLIQASTLILQGEADTTVLPSGARQLYAKLNVKDKKLEVFPDAGHWFYDALCPVSPRAKQNQEKRGQVIAIINDWLTKLG
jgi:alpha-beta hydrolase superfamily lysophospholipase